VSRKAYVLTQIVTCWWREWP